MIRPTNSPKKSAKAAQRVTSEAATNAQTISELQQTISASRLSTFLQCRLRFFFQYVLGLKRPKQPALHVGQCVHHVLKTWNRARWKGEHINSEALQVLYNQVWAQQGDEPVEWKSEDEENEQQRIGWSLLECYFRDSPLNPEVKPEAVEVPVEADLSSHGLPLLVGVIDLVQEKRIVDFKTSSSTPAPAITAHLNEVQASTYALLYRETTGDEERGIEFHHLVKLKKPKLVVTALQPMSAKQQARLFHLIDSYIEGLERLDFVPSPGLGCFSCPFFKECRAWS